MTKSKSRHTKPSAPVKDAPRNKQGASKPPASKKPATKLDRVIALLARNGGATIADLVKATDWQPHTVRSVISRTIKGGRHDLVSEKPKDGARIYRIRHGRAVA